MGDDRYLSEAIRTIEGLIVGDPSRDLPDPGLGVVLSTGLFLGRALREADFLVDRRVVVHRTRTLNTDTTRNAEDAAVTDTVVVEFSYHLPDGTADQRPARDLAYILDTKIRGAILQPEYSEPLGLSFRWVETTERGTLDSHPTGYGSYEFLVLSSTYSVQRIESLTGGAST